MGLLQGKEFHAVHHFPRFEHAGDQRQIGDEFTNANALLMRLNDAREFLIFALPAGRLCQQVFVLGDRNSAKRSGAIKPGGVRQPGCIIPLRGQNVYATRQQFGGDWVGNMHIQVKRQAHADLPKAARRLRIGDSPDRALNSSAKRNPVSISVSSSGLWS